MTKVAVRDNDVSSGMKAAKRFAGKLLKDTGRRVYLWKPRKREKKTFVKKFVQKVRRVVDNQGSDASIVVPALRSGSAMTRGLKDLLC